MGWEVFAGPQGEVLADEGQSVSQQIRAAHLLWFHVVDQPGSDCPTYR